MPALGQIWTRYASPIVHVAFVGGIGVPELLIVLVIALVIFGGRRLPQIGKDLGSGMRGFKESITGKDDSPETPEVPERTGEHAETAETTEPVVDGEVVRDHR